MKLRNLIILLALVGALFVACEDDNTVYDPAPAAPQNVLTVTGDGGVYVYFKGLYERDIEQYLIYRSFEEFDNYVEIGSVAALPNATGDTLFVYQYLDNSVTNGTTYFYAVAAVDFAGHVSDLSAELAMDTPRPEGPVSLFPINDVPEASGFILATHTVVNGNSPAVDIWIDSLHFGTDTIYYINVGNVMTDIQDMGYTDSFNEISYSPEFGWSSLGYFELILGHTYVIWTADDHYAKMRVESFNVTGSVTFRWAYQTDQSNLELAPPIKVERADKDANFLGTNKRMTLLK